MSGIVKDLVNECAELRVENSELKSVLSELHRVYSHIEDDSECNYESTKEIRHYTRMMDYRSAKILLEHSLDKVNMSEIVTFS